ncbi:hypothetical protein ACFR99_20085 [Haloarchaeobius amylolyticus]|uniref:MFS transporter n=1 Tax=Haloarchaeobius amylolyticus TaxID=1198296 RepID=A0ABD6BMK6_9EURY
MVRSRKLAVFALVGLFGTNAIPHFVRGITGQRHMTPFGSDSSALCNVLWGSTNAAVAGGLAWQYRDAIDGVSLATAFASGVALAAVLASFWSEENPKLPWE